MIEPELLDAMIVGRAANDRFRGGMKNGQGLIGRFVIPPELITVRNEHFHSCDIIALQSKTKIDRNAKYSVANTLEIDTVE